MNKPHRFVSFITETGTCDHSAQRVLKKTYFLLSLCVGFSAITAAVSMALQLPRPGFLMIMACYFCLLFLVTRNRNNRSGLLFVFALTGFLGYTIGPVISHHLRLQNGHQIVLMALGGTALVFIVMSGIALLSSKNFSFLSGFLSTGILVAILSCLVAFFFHIPALSLAVSAVFILLMSGLILYKTNQIVHNGETSYIMATVTLFVSLFSLFSNLLHLLGFANKSN